MPWLLARLCCPCDEAKFGSRLDALKPGPAPPRSPRALLEPGPPDPAPPPPGAGPLQNHFKATSAASSLALLTYCPSYQKRALNFCCNEATLTVADQAVRPPLRSLRISYAGALAPAFRQCSSSFSCQFGPIAPPPGEPGFVAIMRKLAPLGGLYNTRRRCQADRQISSTRIWKQV